VDTYWHELMPHAPVIHDAARRAAYFRERFAWEGGNRHPFWAVVDGRSVGFVSLALDEAKKLACINDFYVMPAERCKGYGSALVQALYRYLDEWGVELIELDVRRDNPAGTAFIGALSSDFA
jgi:GNAT superfamily N-acetyltransferase